VIAGQKFEDSHKEIDFETGKSWKQVNSLAQSKTGKNLKHKLVRAVPLQVLQ
jgi:hypothetical protein